MICPSCRAQIQDGSETCNFCGFRFSNSPEWKHETLTAKLNYNIEQPLPRRRRSEPQASQPRDAERIAKPGFTRPVPQETPAPPQPEKPKHIVAPPPKARPDETRRTVRQPVSEPYQQPVQKQAPAAPQQPVQAKIISPGEARSTRSGFAPRRTRRVEVEQTIAPAPRAASAQDIATPVQPKPAQPKPAPAYERPRSQTPPTSQRMQTPEAEEELYTVSSVLGDVQGDIGSLDEVPASYDARADAETFQPTQPDEQPAGDIGATNIIPENFSPELDRAGFQPTQSDEDVAGDIGASDEVPAYFDAQADAAPQQETVGAVPEQPAEDDPFTVKMTPELEAAGIVLGDSTFTPEPEKSHVDPQVDPFAVTLTDEALQAGVSFDETPAAEAETPQTEESDPFEIKYVPDESEQPKEDTREVVTDDLSAAANDSQGDPFAVTISEETLAKEPTIPADATPVAEPVAEEAIMQTEDTPAPQEELSQDTTREIPVSQPVKPTPAAEPAAKKRMSGGVKALIWCFVVLLLVGVGYVGNLWVTNTYGTYNNFFQAVFGGGSQESKNVKIEEYETEDGKAAHKITVADANGAKLVVSSLNREYEFKDGVAAFAVLDSYWIAKEPSVTEETANVRLKMYVIDSNGKQKDVPQQEFQVNIPVAYANIKMETADNTTPNETYAITIQLQDKSTILINGEDVTGQVENGILAYTANLSLGTNTINVVVKQERCRPLYQDIIVTRTNADGSVPSTQQATPADTSGGAASSVPTSPADEEQQTNQPTSPEDDGPAA